MEKIKMQTPLVEMDGDEMTRILWQIIKDELLTPYLELNTEYHSKLQKTIKNSKKDQEIRSSRKMCHDHAKRSQNGRV